MKEKSFCKRKNLPGSPFLRFLGMSGGFTLKELMILMSLLSILLAVFLPKYGNMLRDSKEGATLQGLGNLRTALTLYSIDHDGVYPNTLLPSVLVPRYLKKIPECYTREHGSSRAMAPSGGFQEDRVGWGYLSESHRYGPARLYIPCVHKDSRGIPWSQR